MHVADGILTAPVLAGGALASAGLLAVTLPRLADAEVPRTAVMTAAFFVGSLLAFPLGGTSVHLTLAGLLGIVLGRGAFPSVAVGVALQAALLQHGGLTTIGVNAATMGIGALAAGAIFDRRGGGVDAARDARWGAIAAAAGTLVSLALYAALLLSAGEAMRGVAYIAFALHAPVVAIEAAVASGAVGYLAKVKPSLLRPRPLQAEGAP